MLLSSERSLRATAPVLLNRLFILRHCLFMPLVNAPLRDAWANMRHRALRDVRWVRYNVAWCHGHFFFFFFFLTTRVLPTRGIVDVSDAGSATLISFPNVAGLCRLAHRSCHHTYHAPNTRPACIRPTLTSTRLHGRRPSRHDIVKTTHVPLCLPWHIFSRLITAPLTLGCTVGSLL